MKRKIYLELLEEYDNVDLYSYRFEGEEYSEYENFLLRFIDELPDDIGAITHRIDRIIEEGILERHYRYAGKFKDRVIELPGHIDKTNLRLYCINFSSQVLILGSGGLKETRTYNEDPLLNSYVELLQQLDKQLSERERNGTITLSGKLIEGNLEFTIEIS